MKPFSAFLLVTLLIFMTATAFGCADAPEETAMDTDSADAAEEGGSVCPSLVGSWELVQINETAGALTGEFESDPNYQEAPTLKILNETHWMFIRQSADEFVHAQGGRYSLDPGGFYTEVVEYSAIPENVGKQFMFECELEGDSIWHHVGGVSDNRYDEVWHRVR